MLRGTNVQLCPRDGRKGEEENSPKSAITGSREGGLFGDYLQQ